MQGYNAYEGMQEMVAVAGTVMEICEVKVGESPPVHGNSDH